MKKETKNEKSMFKMSIIRCISIALLILSITCCLMTFANVKFQHAEIEQQIEIDTSKNADSMMIDLQIDVLSHESIRIQLIKEVDKYIRKTTRGKHDKMLAQYLVDNSIKHDIDLCFMMGQTKIETSFGTTGAGRSTSRRSLFGIIKKHWNNYNDAINDYCLLLKKSYLVKGRTEQDLMKKYVTGSGSRYAGAMSYEVELRRTYNDICRTTKINDLQNEYKLLLASKKSDSINIDSAKNS